MGGGGGLKADPAEAAVFLSFFFFCLVKSTFWKYFSWCKCCKRNAPRHQDHQLSVCPETMIPEAIPDCGPLNTIVDEDDPRSV